MQPDLTTGNWTIINMKTNLKIHLCLPSGQLKLSLATAILGFLLLLAFAQNCFSNQHNSTLTQRINHIISLYGRNSNVGIYIQSLSTGQVLYQKNADQLFMPASTLKIFTAVAALIHLGPDYQFQTKILAKNGTTDINNKSVNGDIYFYFDGDPSLTRDNLNQMIANLSQMGIKTVTGNIYIDDSIFDQVNYGPGWMWDERNFCYAAPTSAIALDKNCFPVQLIPAKTENEPATIAINENYSVIPIKSTVISKHAPSDECPFDIQANTENAYFFSGCVKPKSPTVDLLIALRNIRSYVKSVIATQLQANGIALNGKIKFVAVPNSSDTNAMQVLSSHNSQSLAELVTVMLKQSDNLIANSIYKKLGNSYFHKPATWKNSAAATSNILNQKINIDFSQLKIVDGSGLSRYNLLTPKQLSAVLCLSRSNAKKNLHRCSTKSRDRWNVKVSARQSTRKSTSQNWLNGKYLFACWLYHTCE